MPVPDFRSYILYHVFLTFSRSERENFSFFWRIYGNTAPEYRFLRAFRTRFFVTNARLNESFQE
ncbi:MAG TPA: hypothetical protein DCE65_04135 [Clostridiales bacterium]|nr:hypothetical protein [Clostridiales bacterium]